MKFSGSNINFFGLTLNGHEPITPRTRNLLTKHGLSVKQEGRLITIESRQGYFSSNEFSVDAQIFVDQKSNVDSVYYNLLSITRNYLSKSGLTNDERASFQRLQDALNYGYKATKHDAVSSFVEALSHERYRLNDQNSWQRFLYDVISILTVVPALIRSLVSYSNYGSFQFWLPDSQQALNGMESSLSSYIKPSR